MTQDMNGNTTKPRNTIARPKHLQHHIRNNKSGACMSVTPGCCGMPGRAATTQPRRLYPEFPAFADAAKPAANCRPGRPSGVGPGRLLRRCTMWARCGCGPRWRPTPSCGSCSSSSCAARWRRARRWGCWRRSPSVGAGGGWGGLSGGGGRGRGGAGGAVHWWGAWGGCAKGGRWLKLWLPTCQLAAVHVAQSRWYSMDGLGAARAVLAHIVQCTS